MVAVLFGLLDSMVWIAAYEYGRYFSLYYAIAVPCKAVILVIFIRVVRFKNARLLWPVYAPIGVTVFASIIQGTTGFEGVIQPIGTVISLALTIMILGEDNLTSYMKAFGIACFLSCLTFLYQMNVGEDVWTQSGRYTFIYGTQPNLGGEILFTGFIAFCMARLNAKLILATFVLYFFAINLLQSRAAMLSIVIAASVYLYREKIRRFAPINRVAIISILALVLVCYAIFDMQNLTDLFLVDDEYRGVGTGFVGREERWEIALNTFLRFPLFGVGFGYFNDDIPSPHSMWLGMMSMMGLMCCFILAAMLQNGWRIYSANQTVFLFLLSFIPMTIFNDRFLNLNPYPFLFFILLFLPSKALAVGIGERELPAVRRGRLGESVRLGSTR
jgi:O-Antigen ligase